MERSVEDMVAEVMTTWERNFRGQMARLREVRGLTQTELAKEVRAQFGLKFHQQTIQRIESGERPIRLNEAHAIAKVLGSSVSTLEAVGAPQDMQIRYAVEDLKRLSRQMDGDLEQALGEWSSAIYGLASALDERLPKRKRGQKPWHFDQLDPLTQWAFIYFHEAVGAWARVAEVRMILNTRILGEPYDWTPEQLDGETLDKLQIYRHRGGTWELLRLMHPDERAEWLATKMASDGQ